MNEPASEPQRIGIALRSDLQVSHQKRESGMVVVIKDPLRLRFFEMGQDEYALACRIRSGASVEEIEADWRRQLPDICRETPPEVLRRRAEALCRQIRQFGLGKVDPKPLGIRPPPTWLGWLTQMLRRMVRPLFWRSGICDPDRFLEELLRRYPWLGGSGLVWALAVLVAGSAVAAATRVGDMTLHPEWFTRGHNLVALYLGMLILKGVHEAGHAVVCKALGGAVHEVGVQWSVFHPTFYVDVSETWMWPDRRRRIAVAAAGFGAELVAASVLFWAWVVLAPGFLRDLCLHWMFAASVMALLFNANPLMRYDGYHILSDLVRLPKLRQKADALWARLLQRLVLGTRLVPKVREPQALFLAGYGLASTLYLGWVVLVVARMLTHLLAPMGLEPVGHVFLASWIFTLFLPFLAFVGHTGAQVAALERAQKKRVALRVGGGALVLALLLWAPLPVIVERQGVLEVLPEGVIRTAQAGFVTEIRVAEGDWVRKGQVLALVENRGLRLALSQAQIELRAAEVGIRAVLASQSFGELDQERRRFEEARIRVADAQRRVEQLEIVAPCEGRIVTRQPHRQKGCLIREGEELLSLAPLGRHQVLLPLSEKEARRVASVALARFRPTASPGTLLSGAMSSPPLRVAESVLPGALSSLAGGDVVLDAQGRILGGEVSHLSRLVFESDHPALRPGGTGRVRLDCGFLPAGRWLSQVLLEFLDLDRRI
jgi:putative peptide zinc metalloprotease protein